MECVISQNHSCLYENIKKIYGNGNFIFLILQNYFQEQKRNQKDETTEEEVEKIEDIAVKTNGVKKERNHSNDGQSNNVNESGDSNGHHSDDSIPEEDEN